jgi:polyisoprenoid-binding protein YceI
MQTEAVASTPIHKPQPGSPPGLAGEWRVEADASRVRFTARTLAGLIRVPGCFRSPAGTLSLGERDGRGVLRIDAATVDTGNRLRDRHLRSPDFLGVAKHPELRYEAGSFEFDGMAVRIDGDLLVAGERSRLPLTAGLRVLDDDAIVITCRTQVDRIGLGVRGGRGVVTRAVDLDIAVTLRRAR